MDMFVMGYLLMGGFAVVVGLGIAIERYLLRRRRNRHAH